MSRAAELASFVRSHRWPLAGIAGWTLLAVAGTLPNEFVGDDLRVRYDPGALPEFWGEIGSLWLRPFYDDARFGLYRPLFMETVYLQGWIFGSLQGLASHAINIALHLGVCLLVYRVFVGLPQVADSDSDGLRYGPFSTAFAAGLLFAVHPWHIEPVSQLVGRAEVLATLFALLGLLAHQRRDSRWWAAGAYGLALFAKESVLILPLLLVVYDGVFRRRMEWRRYAALAAPLAIYLVARTSVLGLLGSQANVFVERALGFRLPVVGYTYWTYITYGLWPSGLSYDYGDLFLDFRSRPAVMAASWMACLALAALVGFWAARDRHRPLVFGIVFFSLAIGVFVHILPLQFFMADRFTYLASVGLCLGLASVFAALPLPGPLWRWVAVAGLVAYWTVLSMNHARVYRDPKTLLEHSIALHPRSPYLNYQLASLLERRGEDPERARRLMRRHRQLKQFLRSQAGRGGPK